MVNESGKWFAEGDNICSSDFTHDVCLKVSGDFESDEQKEEYAREIARRLNFWLGD